jgi:hypothetical protein
MNLNLVYKTKNTDPPEDIYIMNDIDYAMREEAAKPRVQYRFGITDINGDQSVYGYWEFEKRETIPNIGSKTLSQAADEIRALYIEYNTKFLEHQDKLELCRSFGGQEIVI